MISAAPYVPTSVAASSNGSPTGGGIGIGSTGLPRRIACIDLRICPLAADWRLPEVLQRREYRARAGEEAEILVRGVLHDDLAARDSQLVRGPSGNPGRFRDTGASRSMRPSLSMSETSVSVIGLVSEPILPVGEAV